MHPLEYGRLQGKGGPASRSALRQHRVRHEASVHAIKWGCLNKNHAENATSPLSRPKNSGSWMRNEAITPKPGRPWHPLLATSALDGFSGGGDAARCWACARV